MASDPQDNCEFLGWVLTDLDNPGPKRALKEAQRMGIKIEDFIEMALKEKLERGERE